jgi:AcrR family transcriptional regulator
MGDELSATDTVEGARISEAVRVPVRESYGPPERDRIVAALVEIVGSRGCSGVSEKIVAAEAGVDVGTFRRLFRDLPQCIDWVWDEMARDLISRMWSAYANEETWAGGLRAAAYLTLRYFTEDDIRSRFFIFEVLASSEVAVARRDRLFQRAVDLVDLGRYELDDPGSVSRVHAEAVVGAIYERVIEGVRDSSLEGDAGVDAVRQLMYVAVRPYLGHEAAAKELGAAPAAHGSSPGAAEA